MSSVAHSIQRCFDTSHHVRAEQTGNEVPYGIVTIGTYVRFYFLEPGELTMEDYPTTETGKAYELKDDEAEIHKVLNEYVTKTSY